MPVPNDPTVLAFRALEHRLTRRRLAQVDFRLRLELSVLGLMMLAFLYWQIRVPLDGLARHAGAAAVAGTMLISWILLVGIAAGLVAMRHARRLRHQPGGPEWLALPVVSRRLAAHLAWDSRHHALWMIVPGLGLLAAAIGLVPIWWLPLLGALFAWTLIEGGRVGAALGEWIAMRAARASDVAGVLATAVPEKHRPRVGEGIFRHEGPLLTLWRKDLLVTRRVPALARGVLVTLAFWTLSLLAWRLPADPGLRHFVAFALALLGAAALAEWLTTLAGSDPFAVLRSLPVSVGTVWGARFASALVGVALLAVAQTLVARSLSPHALRLFLIWTSAAALGMAALGVNYGLTLFPRTDVAQRLLGLSLGLAVAASIMIPLSGWIVLLSAILHSARRLPKWARLEEA